MSMRKVNWMLIMLSQAFSCPAGAAMIDVFGVMFDPANGTTQASISSGGYVTPYGPALFSGGSDDWLPPAAMGPSLGTYFQVPTFQPEYDPGAARLGNPGSSVTLGSDPGSATLTSTRDTIATKWADGIGLRNAAGNDLAIFEKGTSEVYAIRVHNATTGTWTPWYYQIFNQTDATQFTTPTEYDLSALGVDPGQVIDGLEIANLTPDDTVATSIGAFDGLIELGFGVVTFGGKVDGFAPARRRSDPDLDLKAFEAGKHDPDIQFVVALNPLVAVPIPPAVFLMLPALGVLVVRRRRSS
jgi:hypothetical protein